MAFFDNKKKSPFVIGLRNFLSALIESLERKVTFWRRKKAPEDFESGNFSVSYGKRQMKIVTKGGTDAIEQVLKGNTLSEKMSLLFCLRRYLDPWFAYENIDREGIYKLLQELLISDEPIFVKNCALELFEFSSPKEDELLREILSQLDSALLKDAQELLEE